MNHNFILLSVHHLLWYINSKSFNLESSYFLHTWIKPFSERTIPIDFRDKRSSQCDVYPCQSLCHLSSLKSFDLTQWSLYNYYVCQNYYILLKCLDFCSFCLVFILLPNLVYMNLSVFLWTLLLVFKARCLGRNVHNCMEILLWTQKGLNCWVYILIKLGTHFKGEILK